MRKSWVEEINKDADIGGSKLNGAMAAISKLIGSTGEVGEAFKDAMDYTGAGDHPAVAKFLYALAKKLTEGGPGNVPESSLKRQVRLKANTGEPLNGYHRRNRINLCGLGQENG